MRRILGLLLLVLLCALPVVATGQVCGDASGDGQVNVADVAHMLNYLIGAGPFPPAEADCDGVPGFTVSDVVRIVNYLFVSFEALDCELSGSYSFAPSAVDTVFLPRIMSIPEEVTSLSMPVITSFGSGVDGMHVLVLHAGVAGDGIFALDHVDEWSTPITATNEATLYVNDTLILIVTPFYEGALDGTKEVLTLVYERQGAGIANIIPSPVDRDFPLLLAIERNSDLVVPVVTWYDYDLPPDTMYVNPTSVAVTMTVGDSPGAQQSVMVTSSPRSIAFTPSTTDPWITILDNGELTTPFSMYFEIDPEGLSAGVYTGGIDFVPTDPSVVLFDDHLDVTLTLDPLILYPWGDLNCDGQASLTDLTLMVGVLFLGWSAPAPCPCN